MIATGAAWNDAKEIPARMMSRGGLHISYETLIHSRRLRRKAINRKQCEQPSPLARWLYSADCTFSQPLNPVHDLLSPPDHERELRSMTWPHTHRHTHSSLQIHSFDIIQTVRKEITCTPSLLQQKSYLLHFHLFRGSVMRFDVH
jgi:hypothetical protein